jgi:hypothetical protein
VIDQPIPTDLGGLLDGQAAIVAELDKRRAKSRGAPKFTEWLKQELNVRLTKAQWHLCHVAFDGMHVQGDMAGTIFGYKGKVPKEARSCLVAVCGARSGKTYILGALRMLHLALTVDLTTLAPGEEGFCYLVGPGTLLAHQAMRYVRGAVESVPSLSQMVIGKAGRDLIRLRRPDGRIVRIEVRAASRGGASVRAGSTCGALLDECAFFRSESYEVNDEEIFKAIAPRLLVGGQIVIASTPWTETGLLYKSFHKNFGHPIDALAAHAPTLKMLDNTRNREAYQRELRDNPENAAREFDAQFVGAGAEMFFDPKAIDSAVDNDLILPRTPKVGDSVRFGCDLGFASDCSTLVGIHGTGGLYVVGELLELRPTKTDRLKPSEVIETFSERIREHKGTCVMADAHYREAVYEMLEDDDLGFIDAPKVPSTAFVIARTRLHEGRCRIPNHPRFLAQLREVRVRRGEGGRIHIIQPRVKAGEGRAGSHGDIVSAWVLAMYQSAGEEVPGEAPEPGTREHDALIAQDIQDRRREEVTRSVTDVRGGTRIFKKYAGRR